MADNPTVTNQKTTFDANTNPDYKPEADDIGGGIYRQAVATAWGVTDATVRTSAANPMPVVQTGTLALPTNAATETTQLANGVLIGAVNETAPATDTANSGLNGRLQRIAQRLTSLLAVLPGSLGQKTMANSLAVVVASDQSAVPVDNIISQGAALGAQKGGLVLANADNVAPTYVAGTLNPLAMTLNGGLRVALAGTQSVNVAQFGGSNTVTGTGVSGAGIPRVTVSSDSSLSITGGTATIGGTLMQGTDGLTAAITAQVQNAEGRNQITVRSPKLERQMDAQLLLLQEIALRLALIAADCQSGRSDSGTRSPVFNERFASDAY